MSAESGAADDATGTSVLIVDDDPVTVATLSALLAGWGYDVQVARDGNEAWKRIERGDIRVVISDWYMPELDGIELCRRLREPSRRQYVYFILLTARGGKEQFLAGMAAGADDFLTKPANPDELRARVRVAERILGLHQELQRLQGLLPICSYCKKIRDDVGTWAPVEQYIERRSEAQFSHGVCPDCYTTVVLPQLDRFERGT